MQVGVPYLVEVTSLSPEFIRQKLKKAGVRKRGRSYTFKSMGEAERVWSSIHRPYGHKVVYERQPATGFIYVKRRVSEMHQGSK